MATYQVPVTFEVEAPEDESLSNIRKIVQKLASNAVNEDNPDDRIHLVAAYADSVRRIV